MKLSEEEKEIILRNTDEEKRESNIAYGETMSNVKVDDTPQYMLKNFIAFEGIDGSGKSSIIEALKNAPFADKLSFSCEPQRKDFGKVVRDYLSDHKMDNLAIVMAIAADRENHLNDVKAEIAKGKLCITDRYLMSSYAYQHLDAVKVNQWFPRAEYTFYFDLPVDVALERSKPREVKKEDKGLAELFENRKALESVKEYYDDLIQIGLFNTIYINANRPFEEVLFDVTQHLMRILHI